jgi:ribosomal-protein-alanine N-acetyltransferase
MLEANIREITAEDHHLLNEFLYLAVHQRDPAVPVPRTVTDEPGVRIYIEGFGGAADDHGRVAEVDGQVVGMAWARVLGGDPPGYGHIDDSTPELAVSVRPEYRNLGIGTLMMRRLVGHLAEHGYTKTSLSVDKTNDAVRMYTRLGFEVSVENDEDYLMIRTLSAADERRK